MPFAGQFPDHEQLGSQLAKSDGMRRPVSDGMLYAPKLSTTLAVRRACYLLGRPRPRWLSESRDSSYGLGVRRFERELLREESDAVTGGFGAESVRRVID